jgi:hypothetical protein
MKNPHKSIDRDYLWFALLLIVVLAGSVVR